MNARDIGSIVIPPWISRILLGVPILVILAAGLSLPIEDVFFNHIARERVNRSQCFNNLKQIGLACKAYATDDDKGRYPLDLVALCGAGNPETAYITDYKVFRCSSAAKYEPAKTRADLSKPECQNYLYFGAGLVEDKIEHPEKTVLATDRPENHAGKFMNVLFGDGHVQGCATDGKTIEALVKERGWRIPKKGR